MNINYKMLIESVVKNDIFKAKKYCEAILVADKTEKNKRFCE